MVRPMQVVKIYGVQDRRSTTQAKLPWVVRYTIDGRHRSKSFRTRIEADRYRGLLLQAVQDGSRFDDATNEPESWQTPLAEMRVHEWSRRWLSEQWAEWQPRTRASATEALARFISIAVDAGAKPPDGLRVYLHTALAPGTDDSHNVLQERWMDKHCVTLGELDRERVADIDRKLGLKLDGSQLAANTTSRIRIVARASVQAAIDAGAVPADAWPQRSKTRARRKVARTKRSVAVRSFPSPAVMAAAIDAIVTQQPASDTYRVMTAVAYYAGLRPSEVVMLRVRSTELPATGWGRLDVTEADISFDEPGEPKTGPRSVPIPPVLVNILREWCDTNHLVTPDRLLFRTRNDTRPSGSNWHAHGTARSHRLASNQCASTTADTPPPPPGSVLVCHSQKPPDDSATQSKPSSPHTSAPSTTKNTSPTNASTPTFNRTSRTKAHLTSDGGQM